MHTKAGNLIVALSTGFVVVALMAGCGRPERPDDAESHENQADHSGHDHSGHDHSGHDHSGRDHSGHDHEPKHGGTLIVIGDEFAHLELVLDEAEGELTAYITDRDPAVPVRLSQPEVELRITDESNAVTLKAVADSATGDAVGNAATFAGQSDVLRNRPSFDASITFILIKGVAFENLPFSYPGGNE